MKVIAVKSGIMFSVMLLISSCSNRHETISIIPQPFSIEEAPGHFSLNSGTRIITGEESLKTSSVLFGGVARNILNTDLSYEEGNVQEKNSIFVSTDTSLREEAYTLSVTGDNIIIGAGGWRGAFYAFQTLRQLLPEESESHDAAVRKEIRVPCVTIRDEPRFEWRGINVDVARHFFSKEDLMKFIDVISLYKLNILHLHLADDQGWRIEIKKYPELTDKGAWRPVDYYLEDECKKYSGPYMKYDERFTRDNGGKTEYGGYYTQEDMKEIVAYALDRGISILPEIDMPAHSGTAIGIFPQLNCENPGPICPCNEFSYEFAKGVFSEIIDIFPYEYIHLGCDEVDRNGWKDSKICKAFMRRNSITSVEQLQSHFTREMEKFFNSKGKKLIGWDEILEGGISETATAMYWRTWVPNNLNNLLSYGNDVVIATTTYTYFDLQQNSLSLEHTYGNKPVPVDLNKAERDRIIGIHASLWSEVIPNVKRLEYMAFPRSIAFAETAWSAESMRNWDDFVKRMISHYQRMDAMNIHYRMPDLTGFIDKNLFVDEGTLVINQPLEGTEVRYTTDGSMPGESSPVYKSPVKFSEPVTFNIGYFRPGGELFDVLKAEFSQVEKYKEPADVMPQGNGLIRKYYKGDSKTGKLVIDDIHSRVELPEKLDTQFELRFTGLFKAEKDGIYTFYLTSDDGSWLTINDQLVIDNGGSHKTVQKSAQASLAKGFHKFDLKYLETGFDVKLQLHYSFNGNGINEIDEEMLFH